MKIEILAIAEEILKGYTINTNASFLSKELQRRGYFVTRHTVLPDISEVMEEGFHEALKRSDVVITTGGLGPTSDDLTKRVLARIFSSPLEFNEEIAEDLKKRYEKLPSIEEQSTVPTKAHLLKNRVGSAPGFAFSEKGKTLIALPGVPREMEDMFLKEAAPYVEKHHPLREKIFVEEIYFALLSEIPVDRFIASELDPKHGIEVGIYPSLGVLHVTFSGKDKAMLLSIKEKVKKEFHSHFFESSSGLLEESVHKLFISKKKTLALAESCTGGAIAKRLTALPGSSEYFLGSVVSYSNEMKESLLQVDPKTLKEKGAVSLETVSQMVKSLFNTTSCDYALAVSGIAGPTGGSNEKPVGTIYIALGERNGITLAGRIQSRGRTRLNIIDYTSNFCLFSLLNYLESHIPPMFQ